MFVVSNLLTNAVPRELDFPVRSSARLSEVLIGKKCENLRQNCGAITK
jgi:hypothetical protein